MNTERHPNLSQEVLEEGLRSKIPMTVGMGLLNIIERDHPFTIIKFPSSAILPGYCFEKLRIVLEGIEYEKFYTTWKKAVKPELIRNG
jgi:hypothetical protein